MHTRHSTPIKETPKFQVCSCYEKYFLHLDSDGLYAHKCIQDFGLRPTIVQVLRLQGWDFSNCTIEGVEITYDNIALV